uniref:Uncharacterized protein n=1 Tax=Papio anubis TaxID=9555 RepID=A0A8I5NB08_PAPAN
MFGTISETLNKTIGPILSATTGAGNASKKQRQVMTLQEYVELLDKFCGLRSAASVACHFKISESSIRAIVKKGNEICEALTAAMPAATQCGASLQRSFGVQLAAMQ